MKSCRKFDVRTNSRPRGADGLQQRCLHVEKAVPIRPPVARERSAVESPSGELLSRASSQSARLPGSRSAADDIMDIFNVETAFEESSSEKQSDTVVNGAADHMTLDFEQVKAALRRGLSNKGGSLDEKHVTAAANEVDRLVRSTSRSRSISRRRKESPSSGASNRDFGRRKQEPMTTRKRFWRSNVRRFSSTRKPREDGQS